MQEISKGCQSKVQPSVWKGVVSTAQQTAIHTNWQQHLLSLKWSQWPKAKDYLQHT